MFFSPELTDKHYIVIQMIVGYMHAVTTSGSASAFFSIKIAMFRHMLQNPLFRRPSSTNSTFPMQALQTEYIGQHKHW
jgi:hypothetical protein